MASFLELRDIEYRFNGRLVLAVPELSISGGSITGLAGPNGSGKTTLLKLLSLMERPSAGRVLFRGDSAGPGQSSVRRRLCLLPQETYLLRRSVFENIAYGLRVRGRKESLDARIAEALDLVGLPGTFAGRQWHELSGGEAQRVALAARLIVKPDALLLDEPTASVDMESARFIRRAVLLARREWGTTLVIASHHRSWLAGICDRIVYLYNGRILDCSYENILTGPWKTADDSRGFCTLSDGQRVYALRPPSPVNSAVLPPEALKIVGAGDRGKKECVQGRITSVTLEHRINGPQVHVSCGDQAFLVNLPQEALQAEYYIPGQQVALCYDPAEVTWLQG